MTVYDSLRPEGITTSGRPFRGSGEFGASIALAGQARRIVSFEGTIGGRGTVPFTLNLFAFDELNSVPGDLIWESETIEFEWDEEIIDYRTVQVDVPQVLVPDTLVWTISTVGESFSVGRLLFGSNNGVGSMGGFWNRPESSGVWHFTPSDMPVGLRILAVPTPTSLALAALACVGALSRRRRG